MNDEILNIIKTTVDTLAKRDPAATFSAIVAIAADQVMNCPDPVSARAILITGIDGMMNLKDFRGMHPDDVNKEMNRRLREFKREGGKESPL